MKCIYCGAELLPGAVFCNNCGARVSTADQNNLVPAAPAYPNNESPSSVLTWGIVAAAFACTFVLSFLGIVFGSIGLSKANNFIALYGPVSKQAKIGHILSKVGIIAGIAMTVFFIFYIVFIVFMVRYY